MNQPLKQELPHVTKKFFSKIKKGNNTNDCWGWLDAKDKDGYGHISHKKRNFLAHRISFLIHNGYMPTNHVLHSCNNPECCNYLHLREGTNADNMHDKVLHGRQATNRMIGTTNGSAKLTEKEVIKIRELASKKVSQSVIAKQFNISPSLVSHIKCRRKWKHI